MTTVEIFPPILPGVVEVGSVEPPPIIESVAMSSGVTVIDIAPFEYWMPVAQTTALIDHDLGYDPVAVQVFVDGVLCSDYSVVFTIPGQQVRVGFDVSVAAFIRLI